MAQPIYGGSAQMPSASSGINLTGSLASGVDVTPGANPNPQYGMLNQPAGSAAQAKPNVAGTTVPPGGPQTGVTPPTPTNTLTSTPANNDYNSLLANIQQRSNDLYTQQQQAIQNQLAAQTSGINASYDARERQMQQQQGEETATNAALQYKFGRAGTAYAASDADKLNALHSQQLNDLAAQRQQLLQQAQNAAMNGNITLSKNLIAQDEQMFNDQMKIQSQMRLNQAQAVKDALNTTKLQSVSSKDIQSQLTNFVKGGVTLDNFSTDDKAQYEQQMGLPQGGFDAYYNALTKTQEATTAADQAKAADSVISLLQKIPSGQSITIGGNTYTGIGTNKDNQIFQETDPRGNVTFVTVDKNTGKVVATASGGAIGKGFKGVSTGTVSSGAGATAQRIPSSSGIQGAGGLSGPAVEGAAWTHIITGAMPTLGNGGKAEKDAILNAEQTIAKSLGLSPSEMALTVATNKSEFAADAKSISNLTDLQSNVSQYEETAKKNLAIAQQYSNQLDRSGSPIVNSWLQAGARASGNPDLQAFDTAVQTFASEYAKIMQGSTSASGATVSSKDEAMNLIKTSLSKESFDSVVKVMQQDMANRQQAISDTLNNKVQDIRNLVKGTNQTNPNQIMKVGNDTYVLQPNGKYIKQ